jgi:hypothetical protein
MKLGQTMWIREVPGCGANSNEPTLYIKDGIYWVAEQMLAACQEGLFSAIGFYSLLWNWQL